MVKNAEALLDNNNEIGLEINTEKTEVCAYNSSPDCGIKYNMNVANKCTRNIAKFRYVIMTITNQNFIHEEIKYRLNFGKCLLPFSV